MRAIRKPYNKEGVVLDNNASVPKPGAEEVLIKILTASICGTDLHIFESHPSIRDRIPDNLIIGHEFYGEVVEVGDQVHTLTVGDRVASESHIVCDTCFQCNHGQSHLCQEISLIGVDQLGGMAQYTAIPAKNAIKVSPSIPPEIACFMDAYGNAVDTCITVPLTGKTVLITGCGPQGLMAIAIALASGAKKIITTEIAPRRIMKAYEIFRIHGSTPSLPKSIHMMSHPKIVEDTEYNLFIESLSYLSDSSSPHYPGNPNNQRNDLILDASDKDMLNNIYLETDGLGVDVLLEMAGHPTAIKDGVSALRAGGSAVILGLASDKVEVDWNELVFKGITVHFRYGRKLFETWMYGQRLIESGEVNLKSLVHEPFYRLENIDQINKAYELQIEGKIAKAIFTPNP